MKREASTAARSLRAVSLAITLISVVTFATMAYSAYQDATGVLSSLGGLGSSPSGARLTVSGNTARVDLGFGLPNRGLYPLALRLSCTPSPGLPVSCGAVDVSIAPGLSKTVDLTLTVTDLARLRSIVSAGRPLHLNGTATVSLEPFATLSLGFDLGSVLPGVTA